MTTPNDTQSPPVVKSGPHAVNVGAYRQYCGRCGGSGVVESGARCGVCGGAGLVVNLPSVERLDTPELVAQMTADYAAMAVAL